MASTARKLEELIQETADLSEEAFLEAYPFPFLVREATGAPSEPPAGGAERQTRKLDKASVPVGDGFAQGDVWVHPVCPRDPENSDGAVRLGRDADCDVVVTDDSISGHHASFSLELEGDERVFFVEDAGSSNGTFLNGDPISARSRLSDQDSLRFGPAAKFQFFAAEGFLQFLSFYRRIKR